MTDIAPRATTSASIRGYLPDLPLVIWMVVMALALGFAGGLGAADVVVAFNTGFGRALGEFALILLPSFTLAATLSRRSIASNAAGRTAALASPVAAAGMICPDTAYAALSPAAGRYKLDTAFGAYTGFKLLYPAGPMIVAAGLGVSGSAGVEPAMLLLFGALLTLPVWAAGAVWARLWSAETTHSGDGLAADNGDLLVAFAPFVLMAGLLVVGGVVDDTGVGLLDFLLLPKGALLAAAILALLQTPADRRRDCLDSAVRRTASLLLVIGAASAFGAVLTGMIALDHLVPEGSGTLTLMALFALTVLFKLAQGSSMATFAAISPVAAPIVMTSGVNEIGAIFAICLGSFIAILPNDSFYWLVRRDALEGEGREGHAIRVLSGGTIVQAMVGMAMLFAMIALWP